MLVLKNHCYNTLNALRSFNSKILTVKGQGLKFKSSHRQDPQYSLKSGHIQWITSFQQTYVHIKIEKKNVIFAGHKLNLYFIDKAKIEIHLLAMLYTINS